MQHDPRAFLWDVREAALAIQTFTTGLDVVAYENNALVQAAVGPLGKKQVQATTSRALVVTSTDLNAAALEGFFDVFRYVKLERLRAGDSHYLPYRAL